MRCSYCHEDFTVKDHILNCKHCQSKTHHECFKELGYCPNCQHQKARPKPKIVINNASTGKRPIAWWIPLLVSLTLLAYSQTANFNLQSTINTYLKLYTRTPSAHPLATPPEQLNVNITLALLITLQTNGLLLTITHANTRGKGKETTTLLLAWTLHTLTTTALSTVSMAIFCKLKHLGEHQALPTNTLCEMSFGAITVGGTALYHSYLNNKEPNEKTAATAFLAALIFWPLGTKLHQALLALAVSMERL